MKRVCLNSEAARRENGRNRVMPIPPRLRSIRTSGEPPSNCAKLGQNCSTPRMAFAPFQSEAAVAYRKQSRSEKGAEFVPRL